MKIISSLLFAVLIFHSIYPQDINYQFNDDSVVVKPDYRNCLNIPEYNPALMPLDRQTTGTGVWTELNPRVPRVDYLGIHFVNKDTGWACGANGALIKSTNGGSSWTVSQTNTTTPILKVRSYNGQIVIASGYAGKILRSSDDGETFVQVTSNVTGDLWGLQMLNDTLGWACGNANSLTKTTDGGITWQRIFTPGYTSDYWWIDFLNDSYGFIAANGKVLRTSDGGNNWEIIQAGDNQALYCIDVIDSLHIAAAGYGGTSYRGKNIYSSDGGYIWINGGPLTFEAVNCIQYVNPDTGYLVMTNVSARKTTNRGQDWTTIQGVSDNYELQFIGENIGYSAGTGLMINKADGNLDVWNRLIVNDNFADVCFVNENKGFAISGDLSTNQALYKTLDGGVSWVKVQNAPSGNTIHFIDSLTGFIATTSSTIYKTTDGGNSWYATNGITNIIAKIFFVNSQTGWAAGGHRIFKTTDGGENWFEQLYDNVGSFNSISFIDSLYGWVSNLAEWLYKTTDGGENWIQQTSSNIYSTTDIYLRDSLNGFVVKLLDLYKTTNSGNNWVIQVNSQYVIRSFGWLSLSHGFIMGDGVYETIDSGNTWNEIIELRNIGLRKFQSPKSYVGYSSGYLGLIYKYLDTTIVPVEFTSFIADVDKDIVVLNWSTATEINNLGFEILRSSHNQNWNSLGFINGNGTATLIHNYQFTDRTEISGIYYYKLRQIDYNGDFNYSNIIEVNVNIPIGFELLQNFPNPFNSSSTIKFDLPKDGLITLEVYDILGRKIATLINENRNAGRYHQTFDGSSIASGVYIYKIQAGSFINSKKMILSK